MTPVGDSIPRKKRGCPPIKKKIPSPSNVPRESLRKENVNPKRSVVRAKDDLLLFLEERHEKTTFEELIGLSLPLLASKLQVIIEKLGAYLVAPLF